MATTDLGRHGAPGARLEIQPVSGFWKGYAPEPWWFSDTQKFDPRLSIPERIFKVWGAQPGAPGVPNLPVSFYMNAGETKGSLPAVPITKWFAPPPPPPRRPPPPGLPPEEHFFPFEPTTPLPAPEVPMLPVPITRVPAPTAVPVSLRPEVGRIAVGPVAPSEGWKEAIIGGVGGFITGGPGGAAAGAIAGWGIGGGETPSSPGVATTGFGPTPCPIGFRWDGARCVKEGIVGGFERFVPGGATGTLPTEPVTTNGTTMGAFGIPASLPSQVGQTQYGPILRCRRGSVLGSDNLCYPKGSIPNKYRKWPRGARPLLTGGDMKTLRKIGSLQTRVKRAWTSAGKPGNRPAPKPCNKDHHHHK